jgi:Ca-activated chloride channel family protein
MNAGRFKSVLQAALVVMVAQAAFADSAGLTTSQGNALYKQGNFNEAINKYDQALVDAPEALEPKFNKANSYFRLDDLNAAMDLYKEVAAESKDMNLVAKAKYNLGNSYFQQGSKQKDSNLQKAIEDLETAIGSWRGVLDIEPANQKAAKNIEVARLTIKDLLDQLNKQKKQQQDPNKPQDPNQQSQQNQQKQDSQQNPNQPDKDKQQQQASSQEPNQPKDPNRPQEPNQPGEQQKEQPETGRQEQKQTAAPDATAQQILDREQQQRKERQILQRGAWQKVEKDW